MVGPVCFGGRRTLSFCDPIPCDGFGMVLLKSAFVPDILLIPSPALAYESEEDTPDLSCVIANSLFAISTSK